MSFPNRQIPGRLLQLEIIGGILIMLCRASLVSLSLLLTVASISFAQEINPQAATRKLVQAIERLDAPHFYQALEEGAEINVIDPITGVTPLMLVISQIIHISDSMGTQKSASPVITWCLTPLFSLLQTGLLSFHIGEIARSPSNFILVASSLALPEIAFIKLLLNYTYQTLEKQRNQYIEWMYLLATWKNMDFTNENGKYTLLMLHNILNPHIENQQTTKITVPIARGTKECEAENYYLFIKPVFEEFIRYLHFDKHVITTLLPEFNKTEGTP